MKTLQKFVLLLTFAFSLHSRAETTDVKISGTVVDAQGNPVAGATVESYQFPTRMRSVLMDLEAKQQTTTDSKGGFVLSVSRGMGTVVVKKADSAPTWRTWYTAPPDMRKIILPKPSALAGTVADDTGKPVADAEVWVSAAIDKMTVDMGQPNYLFGKITREVFSTRTSADGKFRIENFPSDAQASLMVKKQGMALHATPGQARYDQLPYNAGQEDVRLVLDPAGSVTGKVVVRGSGQPLAHAVVGLQPSTPMNFVSMDTGTIVSGPDGTFRIPDVAAGSYQVIVTFTNEPIPDWVADSVPVTVVSGETVRDVQVQAYKGGVVEVTVRGKNNHEPLANAGVSVNQEEYSRGGETGTNGVAYFRLPTGQFSLYVTKSGWSPAQSQAAVTEGQTSRVTIDLDAPNKIAGVVHDASGAPLAGASVGVFPNYGGDMMDARSDADGHYELGWQKPSWAGGNNQKFYVLARHVEQKLAAVQEIDDTTKTMDLTLKPAMTVSSRVQDAKGRPVTNVTAFVSIHFENSSFSIVRQPITADAQGRIQADVLPLGERYGWFVNAAGYGGGRQEMDTANPKADHYDFPPLVLKLADRQLAGRVLGTNGQPAAGVQVSMNGEGQPYNNATTDANGKFSFDAVCEGPVSVNANLKGVYGSAEGMGGDTNIVIRFNANNRFYDNTPGLTLTGTVSDSAGNPATDVGVTVTPAWGMVDTGKTDANGEFSVKWRAESGMRGAKYFAVARDVRRNLTAIEEIDEKKTRVSLRLQTGITISGTVQDSTGAALPRANINLNMMAGNMGGMIDQQPIKVDSDGAFTIPALPPGQEYHVYVTAKDYGSGNHMVRKTQTQTNSSIQLPVFKLKTADRQLAGQVLGPDDKPLPGVYVNINGNNQPNGNMRTDSTGHFKFKVCGGPIYVYANSPGGGRNSFGTAQARGGDTNVVVKMGVQQPRQAFIARETPLKPQPWTLAALKGWPANHKTSTIILLALQGVVLLGTAGGIFLSTRRRGQ